jgi:hypothetical protein
MEINMMFDLTHKIITCELCNEIIRDEEKSDAMADPEHPEAKSVICHTACGLWRGYIEV